MSSNEEKNSAVLSGKVLKDKTSKAVREACILCKHSRHYFDDASGRCWHAWADFPSCGCRCVFTTLNPDSLIRAAPALYEAAKEAVDLLDDHVDNALDATITLRAALALVGTQDTNSDASSGTT